MMKIAACSGGLGDCVYSIKILHALNVKELLIKDVALENGSSTYKALSRLISAQGIEPIPIDGGLPFTVYPDGVQFDYDIDTFREQPFRGRNHIQFSMARQFGVQVKIDEPWLKIPEQPKKDYSIISLTPRWRTGSNFNWAKLLKTLTPDVYFIGFKSDWESFKKQYGFIRYYSTHDLYEVAEIVQQAKHVYCNQSPVLAIAQGLSDVEYSCEFKPTKTNCRLFTDREKVLK